MQEINNKNFFKNYAFFILILLVIFAILSYTVILSKKAWNKNLATAVQKVLDEINPTTLPDIKDGEEEATEKMSGEDKEENK